MHDMSESRRQKHICQIMMLLLIRNPLSLVDFTNFTLMVMRNQTKLLFSIFIMSIVNTFSSLSRILRVIVCALFICLFWFFERGLAAKSL